MIPTLSLMMIVKKQIDGFAVVHSFWTLFNISKCYYEKLWLNNYPVKFEPNYYKRYVNNTFIIYSTCDQANEILRGFTLSSTSDNLVWMVCGNDKKKRVKDVLPTWCWNGLYDGFRTKAEILWAESTLIILSVSAKAFHSETSILLCFRREIM